jgi:hypothetical protein
MDSARALTAYGGEKVDIESKEFAEGEVDANEWNRAAEDTAQLCRTSHKAFGRFTATATGAPTTVTLDAYRSQWGSSPSFQPVVSKTATGLYTVTWDASYDDALGVTETLALVTAGGATLIADSTKSAIVQVYGITANTILLAINEMTTGTPTLRDTTVAGGVAISVMFWVD